MAKKTDLKFTDKEAFMKAHPHFVIEKHIPAHTQREPNYGAIRQVLRAGTRLDGVELVETQNIAAEPTDKSAQEIGEKTPDAEAEAFKVRTLGQKFASNRK